MSDILTIDGLAGFEANRGRELGVSDWLTIDQDRIDRFAEATGDFQWIHTDPVRAADGPYGKTIAHGYLTLSLVPLFFPEIFEVSGFDVKLNYGCDRVRFPAPVPVDSRIRGRVTLTEVDRLSETSVQTKMLVAIEVEGQTKPACVAELLSRFGN